ncbi:efflux RND transporter periplasmic adaptor subunit [Dichotomicrobium thermohalophilum]|uniref:Membrane fusion protein (Multidrug efflux system)/multidrug efflux system membrane fusion protein/multidrug efflux system membrane fusion protein/multidrug efflux system membrane fusion protein n=1 Tax=Dichotomicrobium thermohalophilum TaxID=933063 RepID=A0A397QC04_9HYPH|nr:efflux RND transporter periplasmic adaptor subunit [Dichotomicrobium thermohalophilum]RIA55771.1 membrane fusion protein (multidrug efflux system)/multidrug efflux system membrane fusion protein/multidrug efflux system membrane fusion protein/multidrug efflux system membrane fusion protein [Dichotomicrobium thermohalophilum]
MTHFFGRALAGLVAIVILAGGILALSLYLSGQPLFGMLAGTGLPDQVRQLFRSKESANQQPAQAERQAVPVRIAHIRREAVPVALSFSGRLLARREVEVRARVTGYVSEVTFKEGEIVEKGEVLYRIDPRTFEARLKELQGALQGAKANLAFLQRETERIANLEEKEYAETSRLDELRSQRDQAAARIEELQGRLRQAQLDLEFASVEAPFAGKIGFSDVDEGDLVVQGQTTLTTLVDFHPIEIEFRPNADQLARMKDARARLGHPLRLTVSPDGRDTTVSGEVTALGPAVQNATNTVRVRGEVPNPDQTLVPGQFARVRVQLGTQPSLMAPTAALITQQNKRALYVISADNTVEIVPVEIGQTVGKRVVVQGDLAEGDRVVAGNLQSVRSGRPVRVIAEQGEENGDRRRGGAKGRMN